MQKDKTEYNNWHNLSSQDRSIYKEGQRLRAQLSTAEGRDKYNRSLEWQGPGAKDKAHHGPSPNVAEALYRRMQVPMQEVKQEKTPSFSDTFKRAWDKAKDTISHWREDRDMMKAAHAAEVKPHSNTGVHIPDVNAATKAHDRQLASTGKHDGYLHAESHNLNVRNSNLQKLIDSGHATKDEVKEYDRNDARISANSKALSSHYTPNAHERPSSYNKEFTAGQMEYAREQTQQHTPQTPQTEKQTALKEHLRAANMDAAKSELYASIRNDGMSKEYKKAIEPPQKEMSL